MNELPNVSDIIMDIRQESERRKQEPLIDLDRRRDAAMRQLQQSAQYYVAEADSEADMKARTDVIRDVAEYVQNVRISAAEAMVSLVRQGRWLSRPMWLTVQEGTMPYFRGYVEEGVFVKIEPHHAWEALDEEGYGTDLEVLNDYKYAVFVCRQCSGSILGYIKIQGEPEREICHTCYFPSSESLNDDARKALQFLIEKVFFWYEGDYGFLTETIWEHGLMRDESGPLDEDGE